MKHPSLAAALVAAQAEMPAVEKDATNPHFRSQFTSLDHLIARTRPVLTKHGLAIVQMPANAGGLPVLRTTILHSESGERLDADAPLILGKQDMQGLGSAITYARRYAWASACGVASEQDDDGNAASEPAARASNPAAPPGSSANGEFRFASGMYEGKTLGEVPDSYLDWYLENGPKDSVKQAIREFRGAAANEPPPPETAAADPYAEDIPFEAAV